MLAAASVIVFFLLTATCSSPTEDEYIHGLWASVDSVKVISNANGEVNFSCLLKVGTPCEEFDRAETKVDNQNVSVRFYSKEKKSAICVEVLASMKVPFNIKLSPGKKYTFHFWKLKVGATTKLFFNAYALIG